MTSSLIPPTDLRDYLKSLGWTPLEAAYPDRLYVLENASFPRRQMVFPMDMSAPDYLDSTESVISKLADLLNERSELVRARASFTKEDVVKVRIDSAAGDDATLPLSFAGNVLAGAQKLLRSSACTVIKPRMHHPRLTLTDAVQLIDKCNFGHTETGSFVVQVSCPVFALDVQGELDSVADEAGAPFVRQVMMALFNGVESLVAAIEQDRLDQLVEDVKKAPSPVLSSNLCEAITQLQDEALDNSATLEMLWSPLYPIPARYRGRFLRIQRDYFSRIEEVRRELRTTERGQEDSYIGTVERLDGEMTDEGARAGEVILSLLLTEGESIRARTSLDIDNYARADKAHMTDGTYVKIQGRLHPGRQPRQLSHVTLFELLEAKGR